MTFSLTETGAEGRARTPNTSRRLELLELSRLSRRPASAVCANCEKPIARDFDFGQAVRVCRKCLEIYARIEAALNEVAETKARAARLEMFAEKARF